MSSYNKITAAAVALARGLAAIFVAHETSTAFPRPNRGALDFPCPEGLDLKPSKGSNSSSAHGERELEELTVPGLRNAGNNCFLNSVLQALASSPVLVASVAACAEGPVDGRASGAPFPSWYEGDASATKADMPLAHALSALLQELSRPCKKSQVASPRRVMSALALYADKFDMASQQDAAEALDHLAAALEKECMERFRLHRHALLSWRHVSRDWDWDLASEQLQDTRSAVPRLIPSGGDTCPPTPGFAASRRARSLSLVLKPGGGPVGDPGAGEVFQAWQDALRWPLEGTVGSLLECLTCGHQFTLQLQPFNELQLSLPQSSPGQYILPTGCSLDRLLELFTSSETMSSVACVRCSHVATTRHAKRNDMSIADGGEPSAAVDQRKKRLETAAKVVSECVCSNDCACEALISSAGGVWVERRSPAVKRLLVGRAPELLCMQIQRVNMCSSTGQLRKLSGHVAFPLVLDLRPYTLASALSDPASEAAPPLTLSLQSRIGRPPEPATGPILPPLGYTDKALPSVETPEVRLQRSLHEGSHCDGEGEGAVVDGVIAYPAASADVFCCEGSGLAADKAHAEAHQLPVRCGASDAGECGTCCLSPDQNLIGPRQVAASSGIVPSANGINGVHKAPQNGHIPSNNHDSPDKIKKVPSRDSSPSPSKILEWDAANRSQRTPDRFVTIPSDPDSPGPQSNTSTPPENLSPAQKSKLERRRRKRVMRKSRTSETDQMLHSPSKCSPNGHKSDYPMEADQETNRVHKEERKERLLEQTKQPSAEKNSEGPHGLNGCGQVGGMHEGRIIDDAQHVGRSVKDQSVKQGNTATTNPVSCLATASPGIRVASIPCSGIGLASVLSEPFEEGGVLQVGGDEIVPQSTSGPASSEEKTVLNPSPLAEPGGGLYNVYKPRVLPFFVPSMAEGLYGGVGAGSSAAGNVARLDGALQSSSPALLAKSRSDAAGRRQRREGGAGRLPLPYELVSVVVHHGSASGGHYTVYRKMAVARKEAWGGPGKEVTDCLRGGETMRNGSVGGGSGFVEGCNGMGNGKSGKGVELSYAGSGARGAESCDLSEKSADFKEKEDGLEEAGLTELDETEVQQADGGHCQRDEDKEDSFRRIARARLASFTSEIDGLLGSEAKKSEVCLTAEQGCDEVVSANDGTCVGNSDCHDSRAGYVMNGAGDHSLEDEEGKDVIWFSVSDTQVRRVAEREVLNVDASLLFYERVHSFDEQMATEPTRRSCEF